MALEGHSFLFVTWNGGRNVPPNLSIARKLVARGDRVRVVAPRRSPAWFVPKGAPSSRLPGHPTERGARACSLDAPQRWRSPRSLPGPARRARSPRNCSTRSTRRRPTCWSSTSCSPARSRPPNARACQPPPSCIPSTACRRRGDRPSGQLWRPEAASPLACATPGSPVSGLARLGSPWRRRGLRDLNHARQRLRLPPIASAHQQLAHLDRRILVNDQHGLRPVGRPAARQRPLRGTAMPAGCAARATGRVG
jgi:hypothetical protein